MSGVRLDAREIVLAGEAMAAAVVRIDQAMNFEVPFVNWSSDTEVEGQVADLGRHVVASNTLYAASGSGRAAEIDIDRADLVAALEALAADRDEDGEGKGDAYRALAERLREEVR